MPEDKAEDGAFVADLIGGRGGDTDGLCVHHFAHDSAGAVCGAHKNGAEVELLRGDFLQAAEKGVGRGVAAGQRNAEPADESAEKRKEPAGAREGETQDGIHAGISCDVTQAKHASHGHDGETQTEKSAAEDVKHFSWLEAENGARKKGCEEAARSRGREPIEIEPRGFGGRLLHYGRSSKNFGMQVRPVPARRTGADFAIRQNNFERGRRCLVHGQLYRGQSPNEHENGENREGHPSLCDLTGGVALDGGAGLSGVYSCFIHETPDPFWLPETQEKKRGSHGDDAGDNVHKIAVHVIGPEPLCGGEGATDDQDGRKDFESFFPTDHRAHQPERNNNGGDRKNKADHEGTGDGDRRAKSGGAFNESTEAKSNEQELQAAIGGDRGDGLLHDFELASLDGYVIEKYGGDDNPDNFEKTECRAIKKTTQRQAGGHSEYENCTKYRGCCASDGAKMGLHFQSRQKTEQDDDRQRRYKCGEPPMTRRVINLGPSHRKTFPLQPLRYFLAAFLSRSKCCCKARQLFKDFQSEFYGQ